MKRSLLLGGVITSLMFLSLSFTSPSDSVTDEANITVYFIVTTKDATIAYTGDVRAHGVVSQFT